MQIQLNTDNHVHGEASLATWVESELKDRLARFRDHVTRVEVHLSDVNAARTDGQDKRCKLEARLAGRQPVAVQHDAAKVAEAVHGAADKLARLLDTTLGRAKDAKGRESIRGA
jgi:ribosome-associated translation inhibitor RaiA